MTSKRTYVSFDWAIKKLLRNRADYVIVEGLLTVLIERKVKICRFLDGEGNQESESDKFNRVDILAEDEAGELMLFEIQNDSQVDYFQRMAYGASKILTEYLGKGNDYGRLRKVYSINIVYFDLGQGDDYVYRGRTEFRSLHDPDKMLKLSQRQRQMYQREMPADIFPEYYILKVNQFDKEATTPLDEWIEFLKTSDIPETVTAPGLREARERLSVEKLSEAERRRYDNDLENQRHARSVIKTGWLEGEAAGLAKGLAQGREEGRKETLSELAQKMKDMGFSPDDIAKLTGGMAK